MATKTVLFVGRTRMAMDRVYERLSVKDVLVLSAINLDEVKTAFDDATISEVFMGAGIELEARLEIVRHVFQASKSATVHMKNEDTGPEGFIPFVNGILH